MEEIIWKQHLDTVYDVSSVGTVRNRKTGRNMKLSVRSKGYLGWSCYNDGLQETTCVHQAVALAFLPNSEGFPTVDHINRDRADNRLENLQWASYSMQMRNRDAYGVCGFKGVYKHHKRFQARITINLVSFYIGTYDTAEEAGAAFAARFTQEGFDIPE